MYLAGKLHLFDERGHIYKSLVVLAPMILAALIAASRVSDYRHHWHDVTAGAMVGGIFAVFAYRQYYPSLASAKSDRPFSPRVGEELLPVSAFEHRRHRGHNDEETQALLSEGETVPRGSEEAESGLSFTHLFRRDPTDQTLTSNGTHARNKTNNPVAQGVHPSR
jgi:diacylglycerol diphosphate phosphatase/phosphatidate phosphatase